MAKSYEIYKGMEILSKYMSEAEFKDENFQAEHDQIWVGDYNAELMEEIDRELMAHLGWFESEEAWSHWA